MRKLLILVLFFIGLGFAIANFPGLAKQGEFDSIVVNFREDLPKTEIRDKIQTLSAKYNQEIDLNSVFSIEDNIYILT